MTQTVTDPLRDAKSVALHEGTLFWTVPIYFIGFELYYLFELYD